MPGCAAAAGARPIQKSKHCQSLARGCRVGTALA
jgi:hypothetical protein